MRVTASPSRLGLQVNLSLSSAEARLLAINADISAVSRSLHYPLASRSVRTCFSVRAAQRRAEHDAWAQAQRADKQSSSEVVERSGAQ